MSHIGDGFRKSIEHPHFLKVLIGFLIILGLGWSGYHFWIKKRTLIEQQYEQYQAQK